jgi:hypothetical protein
MWAVALGRRRRRAMDGWMGGWGCSGDGEAEGVVGLRCGGGKGRGGKGGGIGVVMCVYEVVTPTQLRVH